MSSKILIVRSVSGECFVSPASKVEVFISV